MRPSPNRPPAEKLLNITYSYTHTEPESRSYTPTIGSRYNQCLLITAVFTCVQGSGVVFSDGERREIRLEEGSERRRRSVRNTQREKPNPLR